jgi:hypothetical protein
MSYCFLMLHSVVLYFKTCFRFDLAKLRGCFEMRLVLKQLIEVFAIFWAEGGGK